MAQRRDIEVGRRILGELLGDGVDPILTPPWNRCTDHTGRALCALGFGLLSREWRASPLGIPGLAELPVRIDWVRLAPAARGARLAEAIRAGRPVGVCFTCARRFR